MWTPWSEKVVASLDERAAVIQTRRGETQLARVGEGPPVLVSHGGPGGFDLGLAWSQHLQVGGCEVLAVSRPGYLRTPLTSGRSPADQADLFAALLTELHIERAAILGFSSGGPAAVHFAARYPDLTIALFLDTAILAPFEPPIGALRRTTYESSFVVRLAYEVATRNPALATRLMVDGVSQGLNKEQIGAAVDWITSDPARIQSLKQQWTSIAPRRYRKPGWTNDKANERRLEPLPFADVAAPTLIAYGTNDAIVPEEHAVDAANKIARAELIFVEEGHHLLSASRNYGPVAQRQLELVRG